MSGYGDPGGGWMGPIFDPARRISRKGNPETSKLGAEDAAVRLNGLQAKALEAVKEWPGMTATELSRLRGYGDPRVFNRRLVELERKGKVVRLQARACRYTGRMAATWRLTEESS